MKLPRRNFLHLAAGAARAASCAALSVGAGLSVADSHAGFFLNARNGFGTRPRSSLTVRVRVCFALGRPQETRLLNVRVESIICVGGGTTH